MNQAELKAWAEERLLWRYLAIDGSGKLTNPPKTDDELHEFIRLALQLDIPRKVITPGHRSPFEFIADQFFERTKNALGFANRSGGKALALDTPILTSRGWRTMEDIQPDDFVFAVDGSQTRVTCVSETFVGHRCFRITFRSGESIVADAEHLWEVQETRKPGSALYSTLGLVEAMQAPERDLDSLGYATRFSVRLAKALVFPEASLPIHPYVLGLWLGDGGRIHAHIHSWDEEIGDRLKVLWPRSYPQHYTNKDGHVDRKYAMPGLRAALKKLGLGAIKKIPSIYLSASIEQRIELLRGLMDSDGYANPDRARCEYGTADLSLAVGVLELTRGLGLNPTFRTKEAWCSNSKAGRVRGQDSHIISFTPDPAWNPFHLTRRAERVRAPVRPLYQSHRIKKIEEVESVPTKCLGVAHPVKLFLAGRALVPTHNTIGLAVLNFCDLFFKQKCEITSAGAVLSQADRAYGYLKSFFELPWFEKWAANYQKVTGKKFIEKDIQSATELANGGKLEIITASEKGFRGPHPHKSRVDEIDVMEWGVFQTGLSMAAGRDRGPQPIRGQNTFTSTRQLPDGPMQRLLDEAQTRGIEVYEWNIWEVLERCTRRCKGDPEFGDCPIYDSYCKGKAHHCAGFYKIDDFIDKARMLDPEEWETEWLNERPERSKLIYHMFNPTLHVIGPNQLKRMTGYEYPQDGWTIIGGIDFGSSPGHPFAYVKLAQLPSNGSWLIFFEYMREQDLLKNHADRIRSSPLWRPGELIYADHDAQDRLELREYGISTRPAYKDVEVGIDYVKSLLTGTPPKFAPNLYVWHTCRATIKEFSSYQRRLMADGTIDPSGKVEKSHDHLLDGIRYSLITHRGIARPKYKGYKLRGI